MRLWLAGAAILVLLACAHVNRADSEPAGEVKPVEHVREVRVTQKCGEIKREWLRSQQVVEKPEGVIADSVDVAIARGKQIDVANERIQFYASNLEKIAAVLRRHGCAEISR